MVAVRDVRRVRNNRDSGGPRVFAGANDLYDVVIRRHQGEAVHQQVDFDNFDRFLPGHVFADENINLALDKIIFNEFFAGELFV